MSKNPDVFNDVWEFQKKMEAYPSPEVRALYTELLEEEYQEFCEAATEPERVKEALDVLYVTVGYLLSTGRPVARLWEALQMSNMRKKRAIGKAIKPEGWHQNELEELLNG